MESLCAKQYRSWSVVLAVVILAVFLSGCGESPPDPNKDSANSTIYTIEDTLPKIRSQITSLNQGIAIAESNGVDVTEIIAVVTNADSKIRSIESDLVSAKSFYDSRDYNSANTTAQTTYTNLIELQDDLNQVAGRLRALIAIHNTENIIATLRANHLSLEEQIATAESEGVDTTEVKKYLANLNNTFSDADKKIADMDHCLKSENYDSVISISSEANTTIQQIQNSLNQGIESLKEAYNKTISQCQELLGQADIGCQKAEIYIEDARHAGADVSQLQIKLDKVRTDFTTAQDAFSDRQFNVVKSKTNSVIEVSSQIETDALESKYDVITGKVIQSASKQVCGNEANNLIEEAKSARSNKEFNKAIELVNRAVAVTAIFIIDSGIKEIETFSVQTSIPLNLDQFKAMNAESRSLFERGDLVGSVNQSKEISAAMREMTEAFNTYNGADAAINGARRTSCLWVKADVSKSEELLGESREMLAQGRYPEAANLAKQAKENAFNEAEITKNKIEKNVFLRAANFLSGLISKSPDISLSETQTMKLTYITGLNLAEVDLSPPEISIEAGEVYAAPFVSIEGIDTSLIHTEVPDIKRTNRTKAEIMEIDTSYLKLGKKTSAFITLKNTGTETIKTEKVVIIAGKYFWDGRYHSDTMSETFDVEIKPGESETLQQLFDLPEQESGFSLKGTYDVTIKVWVNGQLLPAETRQVYLST